MSVYRLPKFVQPRNDHAADNPVNWECIDEFEQAQMLCSYEYGDWKDEEYLRDE